MIRVPHGGYLPCDTCDVVSNQFIPARRKQSGRRPDNSRQTPHQTGSLSAHSGLRPRVQPENPTKQSFYIKTPAAAEKQIDETTSFLQE